MSRFKHHPFIAKIAAQLADRTVQAARATGKGLSTALKNRHRAAKAVAASTPAPAVNAIHRVVNAHGKGIVFRRIRGRIVPVRK